MAYYNGMASDMSALRSVLVDACTAEGWSWNSSTEMLSKGTMFLRLQIVSGYLTLLGRTSASAGDMPNVVRIGALGGVAISFPIAYEIFVFDAEVYLVANYNVNFYQWCAFGKSTVQGLPGTGMWVAASLGPTSAVNGIGMGATFGGAASTSQDWACPALFWMTNSLDTVRLASRNYYIHSNLDAGGWSLGAASNEGLRPGIAAMAPLISVLPNAWNSEAVLIPARAYKTRLESKVSMVADLDHARYTRVDNYAPGQIVTLGDDRWKVYPFYQKNTISRDGSPASTTPVTHSGTFGWAIRYEGP
ncbi:hypothetical protein [Pseudomonas citronellolis]|uniref:hypothetical protein n=1 Tax=Pseudomonas citronellolis TaxID=53408 RepID=UPI0023E3F8AF|nr:hypothetical protein [Pseudomonas citronellolis]MDF3932930.1 hypothetical protein [Pseudomonas citronellolis]